MMQVYYLNYSAFCAYLFYPKHKIVRFRMQISFYFEKDNRCESLIARYFLFFSV